MAMYHCEHCGQFLDDDWHPMSDLELCPDCHPEGWTIEFNPKPEPTRQQNTPMPCQDWDFYHESYDPGIEPRLCGTAASISDALEQIEEIEQEIYK